MAIIQRFDIELPAFVDVGGGTEVHTLTRPEAEALYADLAEALGFEDTDLQGALAELFAKLTSLHQLVLGMTAEPQFEWAPDPEADTPSGQTMDIDAFLARQQALAQVGPPSAGGRNPGSGIGNTHIN